MRKYLASILVTTVLFSQPAVQDAILEVDTRGNFSLTATRESPFKFSESSKTEESRNINILNEVAVAEMLRRFVRPTGIIITGEHGSTLIGSQIYRVGDSIRLETQTPKDFRFSFPVAEFKINDITVDYVELYHDAEKRSYRLDLDFTPKVKTNELIDDIGIAKIKRVVAK